MLVAGDPRARGIARGGLGWALLAAAFLPVWACEPTPPTALILALKSEPSVTLEVDAFEVVVARPGATSFAEHYPLGPGGAAQLPGTLTLTPHPDDQASDPFVVTLRGRKNGFVVIERKARLSFAEEKTKVLRLPLTYPCFRQAPCADDKTCIAGVCLSYEVDVDSLPDLSSLLDDGCFDAGDLACGKERRQLPDLDAFVAAGCEHDVAPAGIDPARLNVFVRHAASYDPGHLTLLDIDPQEGWLRPAGAPSAFRLAPELCKRVAEGSIVRVEYNGACSTKPPAQPTCPQAPITTTLSSDACTACVYRPTECAAKLAVAEQEGDRMAPLLACAFGCPFDGTYNSEAECVGVGQCFYGCLDELTSCQGAACEIYASGVAWRDCVGALPPIAERCAAPCSQAGVAACAQSNP
jgi:hypothetical protein